MYDWEKSILTDSGGFQVMSLTDLRKLDDTGVEFRSHINGAKFLLTPERSIEIQNLLDSTITMVLDECTANGVDEAAAADFQSALALDPDYAQAAGLHAAAVVRLDDSP